MRGLLTRRISRRFADKQSVKLGGDSNLSGGPAMMEAGIAASSGHSANGSQTSSASREVLGANLSVPMSGNPTSIRTMRDISLPCSRVTLISSVSSMPMPSRQFLSSSEGQESSECLAPNAGAASLEGVNDRASNEWLENWRKRREAMVARWKGERKEDLDVNSSSTPKISRKFQNLPSVTSSRRVGQRPELSFDPDLPLPPINWRHRVDVGDDVESCRSVEL